LQQVSARVRQGPQARLVSQPQAQVQQALLEPQPAQQQRLERARQVLPLRQELVLAARAARLEPESALARVAGVQQPSRPHLSRCVPLQQRIPHPPLPANDA
jgi:hypothetical protein